MNFLSSWLDKARDKDNQTYIKQRTNCSILPELSMGYRQFREEFPLAKVVFEEPLFLSIAAGLQFVPKMQEMMQEQLVYSGYEAVLKEAWIANLAGEEHFIAYHVADQFWQVVNAYELKSEKYDLTTVTQFKRYEISRELKRLIIWHHQLLTETGMHMAKNSAKTILTINSEQNGYNVQEQKDRKRLSEELANYTSDKVLLTTNGAWSTVSVNTAPLLEIRRNILQSIASITSIPLEILEQSGNSSVFTGESDSSKRYKNYVRSLQQAYLHPVYLVSLTNQIAWTMLDPFATTQEQALAMEKEEALLIRLKLENHIKANQVGIDLTKL